MRGGSPPCAKPPCTCAHTRAPKTLKPTLSPTLCLPRTLQVQTTQRNVAANGQRKSVATYAVPGAWDGSQPLQPSFPVELKDVLLLSVSPSGAHPSRPGQPFTV